MLGARLLTARVIAAATVPPTARARRAKMAHSIAVAPSSLPLVLRHWAATSAIKACTTWNIGRFSFPLPGGWDAIVELAGSQPDQERVCGDGEQHEDQQAGGDVEHGGGPVGALFVFGQVVGLNGVGAAAQGVVDLSA